MSIYFVLSSIKLAKSMKIKNIYLNWPKIQIIKLYVIAVEFLSFSFLSLILPYAFTDILGRLAQRLLVQDSKKGRIVVQRFKSIKVKNKNR